MTLPVWGRAAFWGMLAVSGLFAGLLAAFLIRPTHGNIARVMRSVRRRHEGSMGEEMRPTGLEPVAHSLGNCCSIHLSYGRVGPI